MVKKDLRQSYTAPRMEAASFKTENGYATSATPTKSFTLNVGQGGL